NRRQRQDQAQDGCPSPAPCCGLLCPMSRSPPHQPVVGSIRSAKRSYSPAGQEAMSLIGTPERARWVHQTRGDMGIWKAIRKSTSRSPCDEEVATPLPGKPIFELNRHL